MKRAALMLTATAALLASTVEMSSREDRARMRQRIVPPGYVPPPPSSVEPVDTMSPKLARRALRERRRQEGLEAARLKRIGVDE